MMGAVIYSFFTGRTESLFLLYDIPLKQAIGLMGSLIIDLGIRLAAAYIVIAAIDLIYQRRKFHKDMMMTKQEVKDEYKNSEGDPAVKGAQKRRMMEASRRRMMQQLPEADVVITNPTHFAVAIKYDADENDAPIVVAKGADYLAQKIKEVARENNVEIVENKPLARMLYTNVEVGELVPPELYKAVAEVLAYVYHLQGKV
ncbi:EscU/YscU/HrcU family type III secretion system export apparatus switch protein [Butyrivibrio sp. FCS014]|uniref:EscU/YscU/HrcU family type III secretion system export apparatus switch protein n=1 Tax=Butyrivibrio sp. FCS014 TaxID=1408304 RepID=UPI002E8DCEB2|nr:EscU/YscU/HrcU family type III secretion system export apparatus switch protein [Butyrivibrio sp. FCS014]